MKAPVVSSFLLWLIIAANFLLTLACWILLVKLSV